MSGGQKPRANHGRAPAIVTGDQAAEASQHGSFFAAATTCLRSCGDDPSGEARKWQRLQPDFSRATERCKKKPFATEQRCLDPANELDVVVDGRLEPNDATCIDSENFAGRKDPFVECSTCMNEREAGPGKALHNETFAAERTNAEPLLKSDPDAHAFSRAQERIFLRDEF